MSQVVLTPATWAAILAEATDLDRADELAALLTTNTKLKFYDSSNTLIRTVTSAAWTRGALTSNAYPLTPGAFAGSQTGNGTPAKVVITTSADAEILSMPAGVLAGVFQIPAAFSSGVDLTAGSFLLNYPSTDEPASVAKVWEPGHYLKATDYLARLPMTDFYRNQVRYNANWKGYMGHYWWHRLEFAEGVYDFSSIINDLNIAESHGKKVWVMLNNRSFHGTTLGGIVPPYIEASPINGTFVYQANGFVMYGPKLWEPAVGSRWLNMMVACINAIKSHPALVGVMTEESNMEGSRFQSGWTVQKINDFLLEQSRIGAATIGNKLFHCNMGWSNESTTDFAEQYRMTDTMVRVHKNGVCPNDLALSSYLRTQTNTYGKYIFDRYRNETWHHVLCEWGSYFLPEGPRQLIDYAKSLGIQYISWQPVSYQGNTFSINDVIAEINRRGNDLPSARPPTAPV